MENIVNVKRPKCFLCQIEVEEKDLCPHCNNVYSCSQDHLNVHRGTIKTSKGRKGKGLINYILLLFAWLSNISLTLTLKQIIKHFNK